MGGKRSFNVERIVCDKVCVRESEQKNGGEQGSLKTLNSEIGGEKGGIKMPSRYHDWLIRVW